MVWFYFVWYGSGWVLNSSCRVAETCFLIWRRISMFFVGGSYDLELDINPFFLLSLPVCWRILDSPGVSMGFFVCSVDLSCQSTRSTLMYTVSVSVPTIILSIWIQFTQLMQTFHSVSQHKLKWNIINLQVNYVPLLEIQFLQDSFNYFCLAE